MAERRFDFRILGPLEVRVNGAVVSMGGPKQRALLALLLLDANRVVSRERLAAELFGDGGTASARRLNVQISRLRKTLGDDERLVTRPPGYLLRVEDGELDLQAFERSAADGLRARENGKLDQAATLLRAAESLWRGRPLADLEFERFVRVEIERLEELRLATVEERIEAELALARNGPLVSELELLVAEHPLRERLRGQLMLALYRSGRQADALEVYRKGREMLVEQLALEPSPRLRELQQAILRQDGSLEAEPRTAPTAVAVIEPGARHPATGGAATAMRAAARRPGATVAILVFGLLAAIATAAAVTLETRGGKAHPAPLEGSGLELVSPLNGELSAVLPLQGTPAGVAAGFGSLWVAEVDRGLVVRVDPRRRAVVETIPVGKGPSAIAAGAGAVWVVNALDGTLSRIDPVAARVTQTIAAGSDPSAVVVARDHVWVASHGDGTVLRIDPSTGRREGVVRTGSGPSGLAAAAGTVWVANDGSGTLTRIDARDGTVTDTIHVGDAPAALAASARGVWVLDRLDTTLSFVDPLRDAVESTVPLSGSPNAIAVADRAIWVTKGDGTLTQIDERQGTPLTVVRVGRRAQALTTGDGIWVAVAAGGATHMGGTLRVVSAYGTIDTIDPAASTSPDVAPPQLLGLTNDGLVTLDHEAGPGGSRLVPDLALSLPRAADDGRTYTFRLRPGIHYSNGSVVKPRDVRASFERLFELRSAGAADYQAISGARACANAGARCDLSKGIVANDRTNTVTFRLARPDPDFLYKLTLAYADVLPASTPRRESKTPLPATGPYLIASYRPGEALRLVRNPRFRQWSAAAQPDGYPDRIVMRLVPSPARGAALMAQGEGDFMWNIGPLPRAQAQYFGLLHPGQVRVNPYLATNFFFLNVHAPPFDDLRVRQALNLALDRGSIVRADGGEVAGRPACQLLPPTLSGYQPYCPYTIEPTADGRWRGPDLARARDLVKESGTRGMPVDVWDAAPAGPEDQAVLAALRQLGYHATFHVLRGTRFFTYGGDSRNKAQITGGGWTADYPTADDFIGKLTCSYFVPGNGRATTDWSELCDPRLDKVVARAASLQISDPAAANRLWAQLDHELTDRAVWLPTITPNETDLVSSRVGNYQYNPVWGPLIDQLWVH
jgi:ABC-type transport system substrate-binding protein/DNA-binding SARP family transcriptional activator